MKTGHAANSSATRPSRITGANGFHLIECMMYIAVVFVILGMAYALLYQARDYHLGLRRNAEDIAAALHAGERWRADIRLATAAVGHVEHADGPMMRIPQRTADVYYLFADQSVWRFPSSNSPPEEVLGRVSRSEMKSERREHVRCYRWEVELQARRKHPGRVPRFFFLAVPQAEKLPTTRSNTTESVSEQSVSGGTGYQPVPSGYQPDGMGSVPEAMRGSPFAGDAQSRSGRQVADRGGQVARATHYKSMP